jgi:hypothetical protein
MGTWLRSDVEPVGLAIGVSIEMHGEAPRPQPAQRAENRVPLPAYGRDEFIGRRAILARKSVDDDAQFAAGTCEESLHGLGWRSGCRPL